MRYLLDTNLFIWAVHTPDRLSRKVRNIIETHPSQMVVSMASLWEITIKSSLRKLTVHPDIVARVEGSQATILGIETRHLKTLGTLPHHHRDPFDRLLVAQAIAEKLTLLTSDKELARYDTKIMLA
jgi:PIN domain nuclease of toxin-antitoxin system